MKKAGIAAKDNSITLKKMVQSLILRVVCQEQLHGYGIIKAIEHLNEGKHTIKSGTMYTTLRRMEKEGLLESFWGGSDTGPDKRVCKVTMDGSISRSGLRCSWNGKG